MSVSVEFRGNFLLVGRKGKVQEIILPNCDPADKAGLDRRKKVINNKKHFAGLVIEDNSRTCAWSPLTGENEVSVGISGEDPPDIPSDLAMSLPNLRKYGFSPVEGTVAARIRLHGGVLSGHPPTNPANPRFSHPDASGKLSLSVRWTHPTVTEVEIRLGTSQLIRVLESYRAVLYSFDMPKPTPDQLFRENEMDLEKDELIDHDFKWLYQLYKNPPPELHAPRAVIQAEDLLTITTTPKVSSCYGGSNIG